MVRIVEEVVMQQGGCGMNRVDPGGWSPPIEVTESVAVIAVERNRSSVPDAVVLHSLVVVYRVKPTGHLGELDADATRIPTRQMNHARLYHTAWKRVEELSSAGT